MWDSIFQRSQESLIIKSKLKHFKCCPAQTWTVNITMNDASIEKLSIRIICLPHYQITEETRSLRRCCLPTREQISVLTSFTYQILKCSMTQLITFKVSCPSQWSTLLKAACRRQRAQEILKCIFICKLC